MASRSVESDFRILLVGKTGDGKSSTGNTIVGEGIFEEEESALSVTKTSSWSGTYERLGRTVEVVDTPGMFDTVLDNNAVRKELLKSLVLTTPGVHAIAFVLRKGTRFTDEVQKTKELFFDWFGPSIEKYACLILTHTNTKAEMRKYIVENTHPILTDLTKICKDNIIPINNKADQKLKDQQVENLFCVLENIKRNNRYEHFSNICYRLAEEYIKNKRPEKLTKKSIYLLQTAGLQMEIDGRQCRYCDNFFSVQEDTSSTERNWDNSRNESNDAQDSRGVGNLTIIDNVTNERIPNTQKQEKSEKTSERNDNEDHPSPPKERSVETCSDQADDEDFAVSGRRMQYKKLINEDASGEELRGFSSYMRRAWRWCKEKAAGCTLQ